MNSSQAQPKNSRSRPPERILLVRNDRVGDLVLTLPAIAAVRRTWPQATLTALVSDYAGPLLAGNSALDELLYDDPADSAWKLARRLRAKRFDAAVVFNTSTRNCLAVWASRIARRVCWGYKPVGWLTATDRVMLHRSHPPVHEADFAIAFVRQLGVTGEQSDDAARLEIAPDVRREVAQRIARQLGSEGPLFGVHPGNKQSAYNWDASRYADLVWQLANFGRVMVTGMPAEAPLMDVIGQRLTGPAKQRVGFFTDFSLPQLAAAIAEQNVLIVSSTGPMHLAGAVGTPCVALFSPHPAHVPAKWAPLGENHTLLVAPLVTGEDAHVPREQGTELMHRISVEQVLLAALQYTPGRPAVDAA